MATPAKNVVVLGSTGSIGQNTLEVIAASGGRLRTVALSAHSRLDLLVEQANRMSPRCVIATCDETAGSQDWSELPEGCQLLTGSTGTEQAVCREEVDIVVERILQ